MPLSTATADSFALAYDPAARLLHGNWPGPVTDAALYANYAELLAAAEAHDHCRFWLLDMRVRNWHSPSFGRWFSSDFAQDAHAALGRPLFIAYVLSAEHYSIANSAVVQVVQCNSAAYDLYPFFFDSEAAARAWLEHQQTLS